MIKDFQTLIVGAGGFLGVIATLLVNAWLSRRQHTRAVEHDSRVLRVAIKAELETIRDLLREWIKTFEDPDASEHGFFLPLASMTHVYERLIGQLGLLKEHEIRAVMYAYLPIRQLPERLELLSNSKLTGEDRARGAALIHGRYALALKNMHQDYLDGVEKALSVIDV